jgi:hypothetical protein
MEIQYNQHQSAADGHDPQFRRAESRPAIRAVQTTFRPTSNESVQVSPYIYYVPIFTVHRHAAAAARASSQ